MLLGSGIFAVLNSGHHYHRFMGLCFFAYCVLDLFSKVVQL